MLYRWLRPLKLARFLVQAVVVVAMAAFLFLTLDRQGAGPPTYGGQSLEYWFAQLPATPIPPPGMDLGNVRGYIKSMGRLYGATNLSDGSATRAIEALGTNALPFLTTRLRGLDSVMEREVRRLATTAGVGWLPFRDANLERLQAVTGLIGLKALTSEAEQLLVSLTTNSNPDIAAAAAYVLKRRAAPAGAP